MLRKTVEEYKMSKTMLAHMAGVSRRSVHNYLSGKPVSEQLEAKIEAAILLVKAKTEVSPWWQIQQDQSKSPHTLRNIGKEIMGSAWPIFEDAFIEWYRTKGIEPDVPLRAGGNHLTQK